MFTAFGATGARGAGTDFGGLLSCGIVAAGRAEVVAKAIRRIVPVMRWLSFMAIG
jgi:hypothetical protein